MLVEQVLFSQFQICCFIFFLYLWCWIANLILLLQLAPCLEESQSLEKKEFAPFSLLGIPGSIAAQRCLPPGSLLGTVAGLVYSCSVLEPVSLC